MEKQRKTLNKSDITTKQAIYKPRHLRYANRMNVIQITPGLSYGDGMGNIVLIIKKNLDLFNIPNKIITPSYDSRIQDKSVIVSNDISSYINSQNDILIHHYGTGSELNVRVGDIPCKKILVFHNVTEPKFYRNWDYPTYMQLTAGHNDIRYTVDKYMHAIVLSNFSKKTLIDAGWKPKNISILPLHERFESIDTFDQAAYEKYKDGFVNILFTGRVSPHKKIEDIVKIFDYYHKNINEKSRLLLIGGTLACYKNAIDTYITKNNIENVIFTGHIPYEERNAIFKAADVFLCMSEHEGFCIPLLEAFQQKIPVVAYKASAVPDTMGSAGVLIATKEPKIVCRAIERLVVDKTYKQEIIDGQLKRLSTMTLSAHSEEFIQCLRRVDKTKYTECNSSDLPWILRQKPADTEQAPVKMQQEQKTHDEKKEQPVTVIRTALDEEGIAKIKESSRKQEGIVLCGAGKAGTKLAAHLANIEGVKILAFCDKSKSGTKEFGIDIVSYEEGIKTHPNAYYVITVQKDFLDIVFDLFNKGIKKSNIAVYDSARQLLRYAN